MPFETFKTSQPLRLGVELVLQLASLSDFYLVKANPDMLELLSLSPFPGNVHPKDYEALSCGKTSSRRCVASKHMRSC